MTTFRTTREEEPVPLGEADLPGPDTATKREALLDAEPRFLQMLAEAARLGWPTAFENDLYLHDRHILAAHPAEAMVWILRSHGTHLFPTECESPAASQCVREVIHYWSGGHALNASASVDYAARYYVVTPRGLTPLDWRGASEAITVGKPKG